MQFIFSKDISERLDKFLSENLENISREKLKSLIKTNLCRVNDKIITQPSLKLYLNDVVDIDISDTHDVAEKKLHVKSSFDVHVLFENEHYAIINKPAGVSVHSGSGDNSSVLTDILSLKFQDLSSLRGDERPGIVHRIDKDTTGCLIIAKTDLAHFKLATMIKDKTLKREYLAICHGAPMPFKGAISASIDKDKKHFGRMCISFDDTAKSALTQYEVKHLFLNGDFSLVHFKLQTGRTHQIRLHARHIGHSVVGDKTYSVKNLALNSYPNTSKDVLQTIHSTNRQMLHAFKLNFFCPFEKREVVCMADLPMDFLELAKILSQPLDFLKIYARMF